LPPLLSGADKEVRSANAFGWHETDMPTLLRDVRSQGQSRKHIVALRSSRFDPKATFGLSERTG
jgi:hypothetical protein